MTTTDRPVAAGRAQRWALALASVASFMVVLDLLVVATVAALGLVWGLVRGNAAGWISPEVTVDFAAGVVAAVAFMIRERSTGAPMLPLQVGLGQGPLAATPVPVSPVPQESVSQPS